MLGNEDVSGVAALEDGAKDKIGRLVRRKIFQTMDSGVDLPAVKASSSSRMKRPLSIEPERLKSRRLSPVVLMILMSISSLACARAELVRDDPRLRQREIAAARPENDAIHKFRNSRRSEIPRAEKRGVSKAIYP